MSILSSAIGSIGRFLDSLFTGSAFKKPHADYYDAGDCYAFDKERTGGIIAVYVERGGPKQIHQALEPLAAELRKYGFAAVITDNPDERKNCEVEIIQDNTVQRGGVTHCEFARLTNGEVDRRVIVWAVIKIAVSEKGDSLYKTALHESTHLYKEGHSTDDRDANHTPNKQRSYSGADKGTIAKCYAHYRKGKK